MYYNESYIAIQLCISYYREYGSGAMLYTITMSHMIVSDNNTMDSTTYMYTVTVETPQCGLPELMYTNSLLNQKSGHLLLLNVSTS